MKKKIVLFGAGEIADVVKFYLTHDSPYEVVAHTVDRAYLSEANGGGLPVVPFDEVARTFAPESHEMIVAMGYRGINRLRAEKYAEAKKLGYRLANYVSSKASTWPGLQVGENTLVLENNVIQPFVTIGNNVTLWSGNHIGHHTHIQDHCFLASHIVVSGGVTVEPYCFIGVNATIRDHITIASECVIGAGAVILKNTKPREVYAAQTTPVYPRTSDQLKKI